MADENVSGIREMAIRTRAYRKDPVGFVRQMFRAEPTEQQQAGMRSVASNNRTSIISGHGTGKTTEAAWLLWWFMSCFKDARVPCTAPTGHQLEDVLWAEVVLWHGKMHPWFADQWKITSDKIAHKLRPETWYAVARTARKEKPDALQGFHADNLLYIVDEASGVPAEIFLPVEGALTGINNRILIQGNPTQTSGYLFESHNRNKALWSRLIFNGEESPLVSKEYCDNMASQYGKDSDIYRVRVLGQFPNSSFMQLISGALVEAARGKGLAPDQYIHAAKLIGVDVARHGDDQSAILRRQGLACTGLRKFRGIDTHVLAGLVAQEIEDYKPDATFVDATGMGWGVVDRLRALGHKIIAVQTGENSIRSSEYFNLRMEMWAKMRDWLKEGGAIPDDYDLCSELTGPEYTFDARNRMVLEKKSDMKKRGLSSPDCADALALTFAAPVATQKQREGSWIPRPRQYDPLTWGESA